MTEKRRLSVPNDSGDPPYYVRVGLYAPDTLQRLPASTPDGSQLANDQYVSDALPICTP